MRVVFMGTPDFAAASLRAVLDAGYEVAGVFTQPDKPKGRGMKFAECETKRLALSRGLDVYQPASVRTPEALELYVYLLASRRTYSALWPTGKYFRTKSSRCPNTGP